MMTKKRYNELETLLKEYCEETEVLDIMTKFREIMKYDPNHSTYNESRANAIKRYRQRRQTACKHEGCDMKSSNTYQGYCIRCFVNLFPGEKVARGFKTKESSVVHFIKDTYQDKPWCFDKRIEGGCSRYRPDIFLDCLTHSLIIEVDENQHESYEQICENKRLMTLFEDLGRRPLVMIRFNPDEYITKEGSTVRSSFVYKNKCGLPSVRNVREWQNRLKVLQEVIDCYLEMVPTREITVKHLFYDDKKYI